MYFDPNVFEFLFKVSYGVLGTGVIPDDGIA